MQTSKVIHRKKFMGGRISPEEFHSQYAFPIHAKCNLCQRRPMTRAITMIELKEAIKRQPAIAEVIKASPEGFLQNIVQIKGTDGKPMQYMRLGIAYACKSCTPQLEKTLARAPSHVICEISRGPGSDRIVG